MPIENEPSTTQSTLLEATSANRLSYQRRCGTIAANGHQYEAKLVALVLFRLQYGCSWNRFRRCFLIGWNVKDIGDYDDLVVRCWSEDGTAEKVYFVQTKHKDNSDGILQFEETAEKTSGKPIYTKLIDSYTKIKALKERGLPFLDNVEHFEMILYTNAKVNINEEAFRISKCDECSLFSSHRGQVRLLSKIDQAQTLEEREALNCFRIYERQASQVELETLLQAEIRELGCGQDEQYIFVSYYEQIQRYGEKCGASSIEFLSENCPFFEKAKISVGMKSTKLKCWFSGKECFQPSARKSLELSSFMDDSSASSLIVLSKCPELSNAKIVQYFETTKFRDSFAFVDADLVEVDNLIFNQQVLKPLVICSTKRDVAEKLREGLRSVGNCYGKYIVVVSKDCEEIFLRSGLTVVGDKNSWSMLTSDVQNILLEGKNVKFHNKQVALNQLIEGSDPDQWIGENLLLDFLKNNMIHLAKRSTQSEIDSIMRHYIDRKFRRLNRIAGGFKDEPRKFTVVKFSTEKIFDKNTDIVLITDNGAIEFEMLCKQNAHRNVHWLKKFGGTEDDYLWQRSNNSLENIRKYWKNDGDTFAVETLYDFSEKVVIVAAEPGMGKSTVLTGLTEGTLGKCNPVWIIRINLLHVCDRFKDMAGCNVDFLQAIHFIWEVACESPQIRFKQSDSQIELINSQDANQCDVSLLEARIFASFYNSKRLIVLADGFDEIAPEYTEPALSMLKLLQNSSVVKLIVTTRNTNVQTMLEDHLGLFSHTLVPFTREDATQYLKKYWTPSMKQTQKEWNELTDDFLQQFSKTLIIDREEFFGVPLHIHMIAMCVEESSEDWEYKKLNLLTLYENFIKFKTDKIYLQEKNRVDPSSMILTDFNILDEIEETHRLLAQYALFSEQEQQILIEPRKHENINQYINKVNIGKEKQGIICRIINGKPQFIHLTFAEYFAAAALWDQLKAAHVQDFGQIVQVILLDNLVVNEKIQICQFLQLMALQYPNNFSKTDDKCIELLKSMDLNAFRTKNNAWKLILGIAESAMGKNRREQQLEVLIQVMNLQDRIELVDLFARMGYPNLLRSMKGIIPVQVLRTHVAKGYWRQSALWGATERGQLEVIKVLVNDLKYDITWLDQHNRSFVSGIFKDKKYRELETLAKSKIIECSGLYIFRGELHLPIISALQDRAPKTVIEALLAITDAELVNEFPCPDMGWYINDLEIITQFLSKGIDLFVATSTEHYVQTKGIDLGWLCKLERMIECGVGIDQSRALLHIRQLNYILELLTKTHREFGSQTCEVILKLILTNKYEPMVNFSHFRDVGRFYSRPNEWFGFRLSPEMRFDTIEDLDCSDARDRILMQLGLDSVPDGTDEMKILLNEVYHCGGMSVLLNMLGQLQETSGKEDHLKTIVDRRLSQAANLKKVLEDFRERYLELITSIRGRSLTKDVCETIPMSIINSQDVIYGSPLHYAVSRDDNNSVETLLQFHANPNSRLRNVVQIKLCAQISTIPGRIKDNLEHCTPLHLAAAQGSMSIVEKLCEHKANVRAATAKRRFTPLHFAAENGHSEVVKFLIAQSAIEVNATADLKITPLSLARENDHRVTVKLLEDFNASKKYTELHHAAATNDHGQLIKLLQNPLEDPNKQTEPGGYTPLHVAAESGHLEAGRLLLEHGANRTIQSSDGKFYTAFDVAVNGRHEKLAHVIATYSGGSRFDLIRS